MTPTQLVDHIAEDLATIPALPDHHDHRHAPAGGLSTAHAPYLAVWVTRIDHTPLGTDGTRLTWTDAIEITVEWAEGNDEADVDAAATDAALRGLDAHGLILDRLRRYALGIPGTDQVMATVTTTSYEAREGLTWTAATTLRVEDYPAS